MPSCPALLLCFFGIGAKFFSSSSSSVIHSADIHRDVSFGPSPVPGAEDPEGGELYLKHR